MDTAAFFSNRRCEYCLARSEGEPGGKKTAVPFFFYFMFYLSAFSCVQETFNSLFIILALGKHFSKTSTMLSTTQESISYKKVRAAIQELQIGKLVISPRSLRSAASPSTGTRIASRSARERRCDTSSILGRIIVADKEERQTRRFCASSITMPDFDFDDAGLGSDNEVEDRTNHVWASLATLKPASLTRGNGSNRRPKPPQRFPKRWHSSSSTDSLDKSPRIPGRVVTASSELVSLAAR